MTANDLEESGTNETSLITTAGKVFHEALQRFRREYGVQTVAFWRLGIPDSFAHDANRLRNQLATRLLRQNFSPSDVPGKRRDKPAWSRE